MVDASDNEPRLSSSAITYLDEQGGFLGSQGHNETPYSGDVLAMLMGFLERQRATFAWKCGGLDAQGLRASHEPSALTLGGMLKHLARFEDDMSTELLLGEEQLAPWNAVDWATDHTWDWRTAADDAPEHLYAQWQQAVNRSRALFKDAVVSGQPGRPSPDEGGPPSLEYILLNMLEEYARHNGHADLIRESVDGLVGHDPPE